MGHAKDSRPHAKRKCLRSRQTSLFDRFLVAEHMGVQATGRFDSRTKQGREMKRVQVQNTGRATEARTVYVADGAGSSDEQLRSVPCGHVLTVWLFGRSTGSFIPKNLKLA